MTGGAARCAAMLIATVITAGTAAAQPGPGAPPPVEDAPAPRPSPPSPPPTADPPPGPVAPPADVPVFEPTPVGETRTWTALGADAAAATWLETVARQGVTLDGAAAETPGDTAAALRRVARDEVGALDLLRARLLFDDLQPSSAIRALDERRFEARLGALMAGDPDGAVGERRPPPAARDLPPPSELREEPRPCEDADASACGPEEGAPIPSRAPAVAGPAEPPDDVSFLDVVLVGAGGRYHCSGILVTPDRVLTAGHCAPASQVAMGPRVDVLFARAGVVAIVPHPSLDVALLRLDRALPVVVRPRRRAVIAPASPHAMVRVVGFGADDPLHPTSFGVKGWIDVPIDGWGCDAARTRTAGCRADAEMVIAGVGGRDTCLGDSGGPVLEDVEGGLRLIAITSRAAARGGATCGRGGVYVRVDVLDPWLTSLLEKVR